MRKMILLWTGLFIIASLPAGSTSAASTDEQAVRELVARYAAARQNQDAKAIEALFTADADQLVSSGEWRHGSAALVRGMIESSRGDLRTGGKPYSAPFRQRRLMLLPLPFMNPS